jgi:Cu-Zn family superoxide dismutase
MSHRPRLFASAVIVLLGACIDSPTSPRLSTAARSVDATGAVVAGAPASHVEVTLHNVANDEIGFARLTEDAQGRVHLTVHARGLTPGLHGMHLHGHHTPLGFHSGDLPNLKVNAAGVGNLSATLEQFSLAALQDANGTALVLHQNEDDLATDTGPLGPGNSGPRIACGVLRSR